MLINDSQVMEPSIWHPVEDRRCYGVVIYNFDAGPLNCPFAISLYLGEPVIIKGECKQWFYVKKFDSEDGGIIPKLYIRLLEATVVRNGETEIVIPKTPTLVQEIDGALRDWHKIAKKLFVSADKFPKENSLIQESSSSEPDFQTFNIMEQMTFELHECRKRVMSANLTVARLKELKKQVARIIDTGNNLLKLDMVVRDENGNSLNPKATSTMELFRQHQKASHQIRKHGYGVNRRSRIYIHSSHSLLVTVEKISWRIVDECEVRFFLFDGHSSVETPFTESVQYTFTSGVVPKLPVKMLFTDLGKSVDFARKKVYLVAYVVRIGPMECKELDPKKEGSSTLSSAKTNVQIRRPYGVAAKDITNLFKENAPNPSDNEIQTVCYMPCQSEDTLSSALLRLIQNMKTADPCNPKDSRPVGLIVRLSMISGNAQQIHEEQPAILRGNIITARKMGFPEVIFPNDVRNHLYINMIKGELRSGSKGSDKNIEVSVSVHNESGRMLTNVISGGNGSPKKDPYKSVVYYHEDKPKWNEYFRISLPMNIEEFSGAHIRFTFKHRSSTDSKDRSEKPFALAYIRLKEIDGTAVKDDIHDLIVYKVDPKHFKESEVQYLSVPYEKSPSWQVTSKPPCPAGFTWVPKDSFSIKTTLCSTKFTQDAHLLELLQWGTKLKNIAESKTHNHADRDGQRQLIPSLLEDLKEILLKVQKVKGDEIVKFLTDVFDALFSILVDPVDSILTELRTGRASVLGSILDSAELRRYELGQMDIGTCDRPVFDCLINIFGLILENKYQNFQSVLSMYIEDGFFSTLAYKKLAKELERSISTPDAPDKLLRIMKCIEFFFKFIIKSFQNHKRVLNMERGTQDGMGIADQEGNQEFEFLIESLFGAMRKLLSRPEQYSQDAYLLAEGGCLKHIPAVIGDLMQVYPPSLLSQHLVELAQTIPQGKLTKQKLQFITDIVHSELFGDKDCRLMLLPIVTYNIKRHLPGSEEELRRKSMETQQVGNKNKLAAIFGTTEFGDKDTGHSPPVDPSNPLEQTEKCVELLGDVMDIFHSQPHQDKKNHICYIMDILLRPIIISIGMIEDGDPLSGNLVAIFLSLLREMNIYEFEILSILIKSLKAEIPQIQGPPKQSLLKFLNDILVVLKNLFHKPYFPNDWNEMILLQNSILITAFEHFSAIVKNEFAEPFEEQPWNNFFQSAVSFLTQDSLQLENFSQTKRNLITQNYGDMRKRATELIRVMWFSLGESKRIRFVPMMIGTFLDMAFVPEPDLRKSTIPIFFDMMHCEFDQDRPRRSFEQVEEELIRKIVEGFEGGKGDPDFKGIFFRTMIELCQNNRTGLRESGISMVQVMTKLMELLLQYREVMLEEDSGNRMTCIVNLLDFSQDINRTDLYLRYLYKLHDLHVQAGNFTEAAFTLKLHSRQLEWTDNEIPPTLRTTPNRHATLMTQCELKEALYQDIIEYFSKAKMFECALEICDELRQQYEDTFNYTQLATLLQSMSTFYNQILKEDRFEPQYFRVAFYGREFPSFLRDKVFVYRGGGYEHLSVFEARMLERYPRAESLRSLGIPSEDVRNSNKQYLQICSVEPVMTTAKRISGMKYADENIRKYYKFNDVEKFTYSRPYHQEPKDPENEFASLWLDKYTLWTSQSFPGIMGWFPVERQVPSKIPPIINAIETLRTTNDKLREMALAYCLKDLNINPLSMKLNGILDAAVMGGVANYEKAFLKPEYLEQHPDETSFVEELKQLITSQVPIIAECLKIHDRKATAPLRPLHKNLETRFREFVTHIEEVYFVNRLELRDDALLREIERASKKQLALKRLAPPAPVKDTGIRINDHHQPGPRGSVALGKITGSFSSTTSLSQYHPKSKSSQKHLGYFKRVSQTSFGSLDGESMPVTSPSIGSATLPRNGPFFPTVKLSPVDSSSEGRSSHESLIPLTQTLVSQRPPRLNVEQRKSQSWTAPNMEKRSSVISITSSVDFPVLRNPYTSEPGSRTSMSPDSAIDTGSNDEIAPPLPPKQKHTSDTNIKPPTPPPKPPLKHLTQMYQYN